MERCSTDGCYSPTKAKGLCKKHYDSALKARARGGHLRVGDFCRRGHKIDGDNVQVYLNHGTERVRCKLCNQIKPNVKLKLGDICINGHKIEGENAKWIKTSNNVDKVLRCKTCDNARKQRYYEANKDNKEFIAKARESRRNSQNKKRDEKRLERYERILEVEVTKTSGSTYSGLKYLGFNKREQMAWEPLQKKFDETSSFCYESPRDYMDYDSDFPPSKSRAFELCNGCPMLVECGRFASASKPVIGVWAGEVWKDGKVMYK